MTYPEKDSIYLESLRPYCDYVFDGEAMSLEPESGVVFVHADNIARFFKQCRRHRYVVVSSNSDFSLHYQADHHPNTDLRRLSNYLAWNDVAQVKDRYAAMQVGPACDSKACDARDRYSLKTYCWTKATFPRVPDNIVHWFCANSNIQDDPRIEWIPYGLAPEKGLPTAEARGHPGLLYVNFALHTDERADLLPYYARQPWVTTVKNANLSVGQYWQDIADHKFTLCPHGNGLDCYRTYEALYLGSIPVMKRTPFSEHFARHGLPVLLVDSLFNLNPGFLEESWRKMNTKTFCYESLDLSYWVNRLNEVRKQIK